MKLTALVPVPRSFVVLIGESIGTKKPTYGLLL